jgi:hypothetical protein
VTRGETPLLFVANLRLSSVEESRTGLSQRTHLPSTGYPSSGHRLEAPRLAIVPAHSCTYSGKAFRRYTPVQRFAEQSADALLRRLYSRGE